ncbi:hypothetical protein E1281_32540 [Actinomadura sp. KC345]|uniref:hypothetical protein n=1 Tax=Actinomadura sp. KC345 TaxID=2530371 RepID=UPI0010455467|nr:hypothetical protein [Actinomadura sp. KC345]TDC44811.1 hypothetical protein E1281_32540 [Actinomadura sp. KC345]
MRARIGFTAVWAATTAAGIAISWTGVGGAVRGTALGSPDLAAEVPVLEGRPPAGPSAGASAEDSPSALPSPSRSGADAAPTATPEGERPASPEVSRKPGEKTRTYTVKSGSVVLALSDDAARLVSATPGDGFRAKVWRQSKWLRVDLTDDVHGSAVFAKWNGHPPIIQVYEY